MVCAGQRAVREPSILDGAPIVRRRRSRVLGLPAALVVAIVGSTSVAWAQAAPVAPCRRDPRRRRSRRPPSPSRWSKRRRCRVWSCHSRKSRRRSRPRPTATSIASGALDLSDFLNRRLNGVHVNEVQGNPFQPDVNYRGYTASPLLGTPQGLSVYMDGVRLNQPFGEVVSWDLIPADRHRLDDADAGVESAVRAEHARRRAVDPDQERPVDAGHDRARRSTAAMRAGPSSSSTAAGGPAGCTGISPATCSPKTAGATTRRRRSVSCSASSAGSAPLTTSPLTVAHADNSLTGNGLQEAGLSRRATTPASTRSRTRPTTARRSSTSRRAHDFSSRAAFSGNAYYRDIRTNALNGDINEDSLDQAVYQPSAAEQAALAAAGYTRLPDERRQRDEHAVSVLALHRQRAA